MSWQINNGRYDTRRLGKIICLFILIVAAIIIFKCCVPGVSMRDVPTEPKPAEELYRIVSYENYSALAVLYPQYKTHEYGLIDAHFRDYVFKQIEGTGYLDIRWYEIQRISMKFIAWAYVYYPKEK